MRPPASVLAVRAGGWRVSLPTGTPVLLFRAACCKLRFAACNALKRSTGFLAAPLEGVQTWGAAAEARDQGWLSKVMPSLGHLFSPAAVRSAFSWLCRAGGQIYGPSPVTQPLGRLGAVRRAFCSRPDLVGFRHGVRDLPLVARAFLARVDQGLRF